MQQVKQTGLNVTGHKEGELKDALEAFYDDSTLARALLESAGQASTEISSNSGVGDIHADGATVKLYWQKRKKTGGADTLGLDELVESALFEIKNVLNAARRDSIPFKFNCLRFGIDFAKIEAESSFSTASIINQRSNYTPSAWGAKQVSAVGSQQLAAFTIGFITCVHDPSGINQLRLQSKHLYAYDKIKKIGVLKTHLYDFVTIKHTPTALGPTYEYDNVAARREEARQAFNRDWGVLSSDIHQVFIWLIRAIVAIGAEQGWSVFWKDAVTEAEWIAFANDVVTCVGAVQDNAQNIQTIKAQLMAIIH